MTSGFSFARFPSIGRDAVAVDGAAPDRVAPLPARISRVALHGVDNAVLAPFHDAYMVGFPVPLPVKEDDLSCLWRKAAVLPLPSVLKPLRAVDAACKLGDNAAVDIATLVGTPRNEAGTPFHTPVKTVPTPVRLLRYLPATEPR